MKPVTQMAISIEQKQLLENALRRTQQAIATLEVMRSPRTEWLVSARLKWASGLVISYTYLLSLPELETWHIPSWVPQVASLERAVKRAQDLFADPD